MPEGRNLLGLFNYAQNVIIFLLNLFICIKIYAAYLLINTNFLEKFINGQLY